MVFKKGEVTNPTGRIPGRQSFHERAKYLLDKHSVSDIKEFINDDKKFDKLPVYDAMIMRRIAEAVADNGGPSMDRLLDRLLGKPPQHITQDIDATTTEITATERRKQAKEQAKELLASLAAKKGK